MEINCDFFEIANKPGKLLEEKEKNKRKNECITGGIDTTLIDIVNQSVDRRKREQKQLEEFKKQEQIEKLKEGVCALGLFSVFLLAAIIGE